MTLIWAAYAGGLCWLVRGQSETLLFSPLSFYSNISVSWRCSWVGGWMGEWGAHFDIEWPLAPAQRIQKFDTEHDAGSPNLPLPREAGIDILLSSSSHLHLPINTERHAGRERKWRPGRDTATAPPAGSQREHILRLGGVETIQVWLEDAIQGQNFILQSGFLSDKTKP